MPRGSLNGGSPSWRGSPNWNSLKDVVDPPIGFYRWLTPNPRMFMLPWYPSAIIQSKSLSELPYQKLQYPTYVKDTNLDAHISVFKK